MAKTKPKLKPHERRFAIEINGPLTPKGKHVVKVEFEDDKPEGSQMPANEFAAVVAILIAALAKLAREKVAAAH